MAVAEQDVRQGVPRSDLPLCVDLDGTLTYSDSLVEGIAALAGDPGLALCLLKLPFVGRAALKHWIACRGMSDPATLPYNRSLIDYLAAQKRAGRYLLLATAANRVIADGVARHLGLFDEVIASDETRNLKGRAKAEALCARFGSRGFAYAGNDWSDLAVWREAGAALPVNASPRLARRASATAPIETTIQGHPHRSMALLRAVRPHQWLKNLLVFVPILTAHATGETTAWVHGLLAFLAFCATASGIYLINDATDLAADRRHPRKCSRPMASGALPVSTGLLCAGFLILSGMGFALASGATLVVLAYGAISLSYSLKLKEMPLLDVFMLGALYTMRILGGGMATGHALSLWLLAFSGFLFLELALLKRVSELLTLKKNGTASADRRGYSTADIPTLLAFGCSSSFASSLVLALFVQREGVAAQYASPVLLWGAVPIMLFWQCRLWLSTTRGYMHDDPIVYSARDWVSWIVGSSVFALLLLAHSVRL